MTHEKVVPLIENLKKILFIKRFHPTFLKANNLGNNMMNSELIKNLSISCNQSERSLKNYQNALGMNGEELEDIPDWVYIIDIKVDTNSWQEVLKVYNENKDE